jgi:hypothetical protein
MSLKTNQLQMFTPQARNTQFWWNTTGKVFAQMLQRAFYPLHQQYRYLSFFYTVILPELGPAPSFDLPSSVWSATKNRSVRWSEYADLPTPPESGSSTPLRMNELSLPALPSRFRSYMTDDHSPMELSWQFDKDGGAVARFAIDPVRRQSEGDSRGAIGLFEELASLKVIAPGVDLDWCRTCADILTIQNTSAKALENGAPEYPSQYFVGKFLLLYRDNDVILIISKLQVLIFHPPELY